MLTYHSAEQTAFSCIKTQDESFYHLKGDYYLRINDGTVVPVNRSYTLSLNGVRKNGIEKGKYKKDFLVHELVDDKTKLLSEETVVDVYSKPLLFLQSTSRDVWFDAQDLSDPRISKQSLKVTGEIVKSLDCEGVDGYKIGLYGSHRVGLYGVDSDLDVIAWVDADREIILSVISNKLDELGYQSIKDRNKNDEYAVRYANRFGISMDGGRYIANKRMRFISRRGLACSLQCLSTRDDHPTVSRFFSGLNGEWQTTEVQLPCEVISAELSYNTPKLWQLHMGSGNELPAISFSWMHQGMGDDKENYSNDYIFKGLLVENENGRFLYLRDKDHFLLPRVYVNR